MCTYTHLQLIVYPRVRESVLIRRKSHAITSRILYICTAWRISRRKLRSRVRTADTPSWYFYIPPNYQYYNTCVRMRVCIYRLVCMDRTHTLGRRRRVGGGGRDRVNDGPRARSSVRRRTRKRSRFSVYLLRDAPFFHRYLGGGGKKQLGRDAIRTRTKRDDRLHTTTTVCVPDGGSHVGPGRVRAAALPAIAAPACADRAPFLRSVHALLLVQFARFSPPPLGIQTRNVSDSSFPNTPGYFHRRSIALRVL